MNDEALFTAIRSVLLTQSIGVEVLQDFQPTTQGRAPGRAVYMHRIMDYNYGWRKASDDSLGVHREVQFVETTVQLTAYDPAPEGYPTDLANDASDMLQSDPGRALLMMAGLKPLRVTTVRGPFWTNDRGQFEGSPNFDIVLGHERVRVYDIPDASPVLGIYRV